MSQDPLNVSVDAGAQNTFTEPLQLKAGGTCTISVRGTFSATVQFQRRMRGQTDFALVTGASFTAATEEDYVAGEDMEVRLGVPTGSYTSGTATCRLGKGQGAI